MFALISVHNNSVGKVRLFSSIALAEEALVYSVREKLGRGLDSDEEMEIREKLEYNNDEDYENVWAMSVDEVDSSGLEDLYFYRMENGIQFYAPESVGAGIVNIFVGQGGRLDFKSKIEVVKSSSKFFA